MSQRSRTDRRERRQAEQPDHGNEDDLAPAVAVSDQDRGEQRLALGHQQRAGNHRHQDRADRRKYCAGPRAGFRIGRPRAGIGDDEQGEAAMPEHVEPGGGLRSGAEQSGLCEHAGEGQGVDDHHQRGEQIAAGQQPQAGCAQDAVLAEQQHRGDQITQRQGRLIGRNEGRDRWQHRAGERRQDRESGGGDDDRDQSGAAIARCGGKGGEEDVSRRRRGVRHALADGGKPRLSNPQRIRFGQRSNRQHLHPSPPDWSQAANPGLKLSPALVKTLRRSEARRKDRSGSGRMARVYSDRPVAWGTSSGASAAGNLAPRVGLEPTTCGLTVRRSTN